MQFHMTHGVLQFAMQKMNHPIRRDRVARVKEREQCRARTTRARADTRIRSVLQPYMSKQVAVLRRLSTKVVAVA